MKANEINQILQQITKQPNQSSKTLYESLASSGNPSALDSWSIKV